MTVRERELWVARVLAGESRVRIGEKIFFFVAPTPSQIATSQEIYEETYEAAQEAGVMDTEELYAHLMNNGFWDSKREEQLIGLPKDIDEFKHKLFLMSFRTEDKRRVKELLQVAKTKLAELRQQRHGSDGKSCQGLAQQARLRYLVAMMVRRANKKRIFSWDSYWEYQGDCIDEFVVAYHETLLTEEEARELARTEPWRSNWSLRRAEKQLLGIPPTHYSENQRRVISWALLYDNVYEHPECPSEDVINDDDVLDGWMIEQKKKRGLRDNQNDADKLITNEKIRNSDEIFIVGQTKEDFDKINSLNSPHANFIKKQRMALLQQKGEVHDVDMPDSKQKIRQQANEMFMKKAGQ